MFNIRTIALSSLVLSALVLCALPARAGSSLADNDPDLTKTRPILVANQDLQVQMTLADLAAARAINAALSSAQLAHWKRVQSDLAEKTREPGERARTIFDFTKELALKDEQVAAIKRELAGLNARLDEARRKIAANHAEIRKLHPNLGLTELAQLPRPDVLLAGAKQVGLSTSQINSTKPVVERLRALTEECRRRIVANAQSLRPLIADEVAFDRIAPFVKSDAEMLTELTLAGLRASLSLHENLNPKQRAAWHELERPK